MCSQINLKAAIEGSPTAPTQPATPPPTYTYHPPLITTIVHPHHELPSAISPLNLSPSTFSDFGAYAEEEHDNSLRISVSAPLTIHGSSNLLAFCPTTHSAAIAQSVIAALKEASMTKVGLPMIDEDGRLRAIDLKVDAAIVVDGERNVVGEKAVVTLLQRRRKDIHRESFSSKDESGDIGERGGSVDGGGRTSRKRSLSEPMEVRAKRAKTAE